MATTTTNLAQIPGYIAGKWAIDTVHSDVSFSVRHMMVSKTRGRFARFDGEFVTGEDPLQSSVSATVDLTSIDTNNEQRDAHIRSADFFNVDTYKTMTYRSTGIRRDGDDYLVEGELSLHGVTRSIPLKVEVDGFTKDPYGGTRAGFSASAQINRKDFGIDINLPMDGGGGVVVSDKVQINLEIEAILQT